jgi:GAF domain-containing protein
MEKPTDPVRESLAALAAFFVHDGTLQDTLLRIAVLIRDALSADMAGITMLMDGRPRTGVFTDPTAVEIDQQQYGAEGRGPCLDAFRRQQVFSITDTATDDRWPEFAAAAAAHGVRSTLSLPLVHAGEPLGAVNLYSFQPSGFQERSNDARTMALQAAIALANASVYQDSRELSENLNQALVSRRTIDYAVGILMGAGGRSPEEAFQVLLRASQRHNRPLREAAAVIVDAARAKKAPNPSAG